MKKLILLVTCLVLCACSSNKEIEPGKITCKEKDIIMNAEYKEVVPLLIDVRTSEEYQSKHIDGAINIEYQNIVEELEKMSDVTKNTPLIVYCRSGNRSSKAYDSLKSAGYTNIYDLGAMSSCE